MATSGRWRKLEPGQVLYEPGDEAAGVYGLAEGSLEITLLLLGDEPVSIHRAEPRFWVGDLALLAKSQRLISVRARRCARVFAVHGASIRAHLEAHPQDWACFYALTNRNVSLALTLLGEALALSPGARVARRLLQLADAHDRVTATQEELAGLVGVTRATIRRALERLTADGILVPGYGTVHIEDRQALELRARRKLASARIRRSCRL